MSNKYLEKAAESYQVKPHSDDKKFFNIKSVNLDKSDFKKYHEAKGVHPGIALGSMAVAGFAGAKAGTSLVEAAHRKMLSTGVPEGFSREALLAGKKLGKFNAGLIAGSLGVTLAGKISGHIDHNKRMANAGFSPLHSKKTND